jgi:hypothetical protein
VIGPDHPLIKEWMFARDILRRLGFQPEDLFFLVQKSPLGGDGIEVMLVLKTQDRQFNWGIGIAPDEQLFDHAHWVAFYEQQLIPAWNDKAAAATLWKDEEFFASKAFSDRIAVVNAIMAKGIHVPGRVN